MELYIGASNKFQPIDAKKWIDNLRDAPVCLDEVETWAKAKEEQWGRCYIFIEVVLPLPSKVPRDAMYHNQIDLLICFSDRLALCEVKSHRSLDRVDTKHWYGQIEGQNRLLKKLIEDRGLDSRCLCQFMFLPRFHVSNLTKLRDGLIETHSAHHIWPTGAHPSLRGVSCDRGRPWYFVEAMEHRLSGHNTAIPKGTPGLQEIILELTSGKGENLRRFRDFRDATTYLKESVSRGLTLPPDPWYNHEFRAEPLALAKKILNEKGFVEIVGAPSIGKSAFAKDLINRVYILDSSLKNGRIGACLLSGLSLTFLTSFNRLGWWVQPW